MAVQSWTEIGLNVDLNSTEMLLKLEALWEEAASIQSYRKRPLNGDCYWEPNKRTVKFLGLLVDMQ